MPIGLPDNDFEPQIPQPPQLEITIPEINATSESLVDQSPSISVATLSGFTADASDDGTTIDPTVITLHDKSYLKDGKVKTLCGNTLFRVRPRVLSFHSPALRQIFVRANLAAADSPDGYPRILSSDTATDFATLPKIMSSSVCYTAPVQ